MSSPRRLANSWRPTVRSVDMSQVFLHRNGSAYFSFRNKPPSDWNIFARLDTVNVEKIYKTELCSWQKKTRQIRTGFSLFLSSLLLNTTQWKYIFDLLRWAVPSIVFLSMIYCLSKEKRGTNKWNVACDWLVPRLSFLKVPASSQIRFESSALSSLRLDHS